MAQKKYGRHYQVADKSERLGPRGILFRSKIECVFANRLVALCNLKGFDWEYEPTVMLDVIPYKPDFVVLDDRKILFYHEIKAFKRFKGLRRTTYRAIDVRWSIYKKLWIAHGPGPLKLWRFSANKFHLVETIVPEDKKGKS